MIVLFLIGANCMIHIQQVRQILNFIILVLLKPTDFLVQLMHKIDSDSAKFLKVYILNIQTMMMVLLYYIRLNFFLN